MLLAFRYMKFLGGLSIPSWIAIAGTPVTFSLFTGLNLYSTPRPPMSPTSSAALEQNVSAVLLSEVPVSRSLVARQLSSSFASLYPPISSDRVFVEGASVYSSLRYAPPSCNDSDADRTNNCGPADSGDAGTRALV